VVSNTWPAATYRTSPMGNNAPPPPVRAPTRLADPREVGLRRYDSTFLSQSHLRPAATAPACATSQPKSDGSRGTSDGSRGTSDGSRGTSDGPRLLEDVVGAVARRGGLQPGQQAGQCSGCQRQLPETHIGAATDDNAARV